MFGVGPAEMLVVLLFSGGWGFPLAMPPLPPDPVVMRSAPDECLWYLSWNGTAEPKADSKNRTELLLAEQEVKDFVSQLSSQVMKVLRDKAQTGPPEAKLAADVVPGLLHSLFTHPAAMYLVHTSAGPPGQSTDKPTPEQIARGLRVGLVANFGADAPKAAAAIAQLEGLLAAAIQGKGTLEETTIGGVKFKRLTTAPQAPVVVWGFKEGLFIAAVGPDEVERLVARLQAQGPTATWLTKLHEQLPIERPAVTSFLNIGLGLKIAAPLITDPTATVALKALGISQLKSYGTVSGLTGAGAATKSLLAIEGEPAGLFNLTPARPLAIDDLKSIPRDVTVAGIARFNLAEVYSKALDIAGQINAAARQQIEAQVAQIEQQTNLKLVDGLLKPLGDCWVLYASSAEGSAFTGIVATITIADRAKLEGTHAQLMQLALGALDAQGENAPFAIKESMIGATKVYTVQPNSPLPFAPCWCLADKHLVVAASPQALKGFLNRAADAPSLADVKALQTLLARGGGTSLVTYQDSLAMLRQVYAGVQFAGPLLQNGMRQQGINFELPTLPSLAKIGPHVTPTISVMRRTTGGIYSERYYSLPLNVDVTATAPIAVGLLLPAVQAAREAARRTQSMNSLRQIALALHLHHESKTAFPASATYSKDGKPLLSWRVQILPFIDEQALYEQFHHDEPWDSEHNRQLVMRIPKIYGDSTFPALATEGKTRYLLPIGDAALFKGKDGPRIQSIRDGTSNTIMCIEAVPDKAVIWTRPDDLTIDPKSPLDGLRGARGAGFAAALADGSVRIIANSIDVEMLRRLFHPDDGQPVNLNE